MSRPHSRTALSLVRDASATPAPAGTWWPPCHLRSAYRTARQATRHARRVAALYGVTDPHAEACPRCLGMWHPTWTPNGGTRSAPPTVARAGGYLPLPGEAIVGSGATCDPRTLDFIGPPIAHRTTSRPPGTSAATFDAVVTFESRDGDREPVEFRTVVADVTADDAARRALVRSEPAVRRFDWWSVVLVLTKRDDGTPAHA